MKIDWSKWFFTRPTPPSPGTYIMYEADLYITNPTEDICIPLLLFNLNKEINTDDPDKWIKAQCKNAVRRYYVEQRIKQLTGQQMPIEDNLDYIENEAERRGLV